MIWAKLLILRLLRAFAKAVAILTAMALHDAKRLQSGPVRSERDLEFKHLEPGHELQCGDADGRQLRDLQRNEGPLGKRDLGHSGAYIEMQDDRNLVCRRASISAGI